MGTGPNIDIAIPTNIILATDERLERVNYGKTYVEFADLKANFSRNTVTFLEAGGGIRYSVEILYPSPYVYRRFYNVHFFFVFKFTSYSRSCFRTIESVPNRSGVRVCVCIFLNLSTLNLNLFYCCHGAC